MPVLQAMDGKFYDVPGDQATEYEVPGDKVKALLEKAGMPAPQGGPSPGRPPRHGPEYGGGDGPRHGQGAIPSAPVVDAPVVEQIYAAPSSENGVPTSHMQGQAPETEMAPGTGQPPQQGTEGDVNPYWWWRNITYYRPWFNGLWRNYW